MVGVVILPENILAKLKKNIHPQWKICFISAIVIGLIAHFYKITNWLPNWDSLVFRYDEQNMVSMGRWFLQIASAPSSFYDLPWLAGLMAIVFHALGAVCICKIFSVKKGATAALIGALVAAFPTVTSVMCYNYVADSYAMSFLFACLAVVFLTCKRPKIILSVIFIALSVGIYQAYITVTIMLILCYLIVELTKKETKVSEVLIKSLKFLITGVLGMALYYLVMVVVLKITGTELLQYQGFDTAASLSGLNIWASLYIVKETVINYFFDFSGGVNLYSVLNIVVIGAIAVLYLVDIIKNKLKFSKILLILVFVILLPMGATVLSFINSAVDYHNLMKMGYLVFYLFLILQYEKIDSNTKIGILKSWTIFILTAVLVFNYILIANVSYHKLNMAYEKSYATLVKISDRIEQTEGSDNCDSIMVLGALDNSQAYSAKLPPDMTGITDGFIIRADDETFGQSVLCSAINDYCGKSYKFLSGAEKKALVENEKVAGLENWPNKNSIAIIDNVVVIKLGD